MLTYHNNPELKEEFVNRMKAHMAADQVIQGTGFENSRGCAVGCTYDSYDHSLGPSRLGFPEWYERLRDSIFEVLPANEAPQWALDSLEKVPVGVDLEPLRWKLALARHKRQLDALQSNEETYAEEVKNALKLVIAYCESMLKGEGSEEERDKAAESAEAAAMSAEAAARSTAWLVQAAARSASWSVEAEATAWLVAWQLERDTLISELDKLAVEGK